MHSNHNMNTNTSTTIRTTGKCSGRRTRYMIRPDTCNDKGTPSPPTKSFPTKSPRVELSGRLPIKFNGHENSHPLELRVCLRQTLRIPNS